MTRHICLLALHLFVFQTVHAAENPYSLLPGTYNGEVFNGNDMDPVVTTFTLEPSGRLTGFYEVEEENGAYKGTLSNIIFDDVRTISMEWTDKFGEGLAVMEFSSDFSSFVGEWTNKDGENPLPWRGSK
jgi:hypothetical protein